MHRWASRSAVAWSSPPPSAMRPALSSSASRSDSGSTGGVNENARVLSASSCRLSHRVSQQRPRATRRRFDVAVSHRLWQLCVACATESPGAYPCSLPAVSVPPASAFLGRGQAVATQLEHARGRGPSAIRCLQTGWPGRITSTWCSSSSTPPSGRLHPAERERAVGALDVQACGSAASASPVRAGRHAACLISDSAGMPRPTCSFQAMSNVNGRLRFRIS